MTREEETKNFIGHLISDDAGDAYGFDDSFDYDEDFGGGCYICGGTGFIVTCIDDMCRGAGECMHGDGESPCPNGCDWNL